MLLLDSDVLIDYLRAQRSAVTFFETLEEKAAVSVVSVAELYSGVRNTEEERAVDALLSTMTAFEIDRAVAKQAGLLRQRYARSHALEMPDALIAATAALHGARLVTLNRKHYPMLADLLVPYRK